MTAITKDKQYIKFCGYGFLKNLRFFDAFFILFLVEKGLSYTEIGFLYASREIMVNVFEVPSGIIADSYGRKNALILSFCCYIISFVLFYNALQFWSFFVAFLLYGFADAFRSGTHKGMIMEYLKMNNWQDQKVNYYGHTRSWSQKGSALSSLIAGVVVFYSGSYQAIFLYAIFPYVLNALLIMSYPKALNFSQKKDNAKDKAGIKSTTKSLSEIVRQPLVLKIMSTSAFHSAYLKAVKDYIQPLMLQVALLIPILMEVTIEKKSGLIIGLLYFIIYLITSKASQKAATFDSKNKRSFAAKSLLFGFGLGIFCGFSYYNEWWVLAFIAFVGIFINENIRKPILTGAIVDEVPLDILTSVISAQSLLKTALTASLALAFGILADSWGIGVAFMLVSSFLLLVSLLIAGLKTKG